MNLFCFLNSNSEVFAVKSNVKLHKTLFEIESLLVVKTNVFGNKMSHGKDVGSDY